MTCLKHVGVKCTKLNNGLKLKKRKSTLLFKAWNESVCRLINDYTIVNY